VRGGRIGCIVRSYGKGRERRRKKRERDLVVKSKKTLRSPRGERKDKSGKEERRGKEEGRWTMEWKEEMEKMMKGIIETCLGKWRKELKRRRLPKGYIWGTQ